MSSGDQYGMIRKGKMFQALHYGASFAEVAKRFGVRKDYLIDLHYKDEQRKKRLAVAWREISDRNKEQRRLKRCRMSKTG